MRNTLIAIFVLACIGCYTYAQQAPVYSQYIMNEFLINPATAGIDGMTTLNTTGRKQWLGLKNTPETYSVSASTRLLRTPSFMQKSYRRRSKGRVGLGGAFISDNNGAINRTNIQFTYSYHIYVRNYQYSFGLKTQLTQFKINEELIEFRNPGDPNLSILGQSAYMPDAGAGFNFSTPNMHLGIAVSHLLESTVKFGDIELQPNEAEHLRQYTIYGFYRSVLPDPDWTLEPSVLVRANEQLNLGADISGRLIYRQEYWAGLSLRTSKEFIVLFGVKMQRFYVGYSFDYGFNQLSINSYGSHEIVMAYKLGDGVRRYRWLERY